MINYHLEIAENQLKILNKLGSIEDNQHYYNILKSLNVLIHMHKHTREL